MKRKKMPGWDWRLYVITDADRFGRRPLAEVVAEAIRAGAGVIQMRDKTASDEELIHCAKRILLITRPKGVPLIINDRPVVAQHSGADGLHLGQEDGSLQAARAMLGDQAIIGRSTHSADQATAAEREGFDYVGVGPVFATLTKPGREPVGLDLVRFASENLRIPFVAIGGINRDNLGEVLQAGARTVAVVRAVMAAEDPYTAAKELVNRLTGPRPMGTR